MENQEHEVTITVYVWASDPQDAVFGAMEQIAEIGDTLVWTVKDSDNAVTEVDMRKAGKKA